MNTISDYFKWRGDLTLDKTPFNEVDAAILARFSYEPFDGIVPENVREQISVEDACYGLLNQPDLNARVLDEYDIIFIKLLA